MSTNGEHTIFDWIEILAAKFPWDKLQLEIEKLKRLNFALPPYRAPWQVGYCEQVTEAPETRERPPAFINVESSKDDVPF